MATKKSKKTSTKQKSTKSKTLDASALKMEVWPGPRVMVPMATDAFLVGKPDLEGKTPAQPLSSTKMNYAGVTIQEPVDAAPFNLVNKEDHLEVGAHLMWTIPYTLRQGNQVDGNNSNGDVSFPLVPNRWLITRFEYSSIANGEPPKVISKVVLSDVITPSDFPPPFQISQYPEKVANSNFPYSNIGMNQPLDQWEANLNESSIDLKAAGPGSLSWSVSYDNVRNVFGFHDDSLSEIASPDNPYYYSYLIVGWYLDPTKDALYDIKTGTESEWESELETDWKWTLGDHPQEAIDSWQIWQASHGLTGNIDPLLPDQVKDDMEAWLAWQSENGNHDAQPDLARQLLTHSMIAKVQWKGDKYAYSTGVPLDPGVYPSVAIGNNSVEAISAYMAKTVLENGNNTPTQEDINVLARAIDAYQKDLLSDYAVDPVRVENLLHEAHFTNSNAGMEWVVSREQSDNTGIPSETAGRQSIPLNPDQTERLIKLNELQSVANDLSATIATQRNEVYMLYFKLFNIKNNQRSIPVEIQTKVEQSYVAIANNLQSNIEKYNSMTSESNNSEGNIIYESKQLKILLGDEYDLGPVDIKGYAAPNDPVIMFANAKLDPKLSTTSEDFNTQILDVRYTGQFLEKIEVSFEINGADTPYEIGATDIYDKISTLPSWNAFPKEVLSLWTESILMDISSASLIAVIYFEKRDISPTVYEKVPPGGKSPLEILTLEIQTNQSVIWLNDPEWEIPQHTIVEEAGLTGIPPAEAAVAFWDRQPWTPIYMDWQVKWFPNSKDSRAPFEDWKLEELDYRWFGTSISEENALMFFGRTVLNPLVAQNIQLKLSTFEYDPSFAELPDFVRKELEETSKQIEKLDILTQSISGFTQQLITKIISPSITPKNGEISGLLPSSAPPVESLLQNVNENFSPVLSVTASDCPAANPSTTVSPQQYSPIRSGHFQVLNTWIVDSYGQIMQGSNVPITDLSATPMTNITWSESMMTPGDAFKTTYGQLPPRISQPSKASLNLLQNDDDNINSNSADDTSPICGWVMANHLDNSLMVFDEVGNSKGAVIRVSSEKTASKGSIRWDASPGLDTVLGAKPDLHNDHLSGFINGLLATGFEGDNAYRNFMSAIDSALWTMSSYANINGNVSLLMGRPLAVVRAKVELNLYGNPAYNQSWCDTGEFYNNNGNYDPTNPPFMSMNFSLRVGDAYLLENGVMGYFQSDDYDVFYPVYGSTGQTRTIIEIMRAGEDLNFIPPHSTGYTSDYVKEGHIIPLKPDGSPIYLTILVDPVGNIPILSGSNPFETYRLPNGPVTIGLSHLEAFFRAGPLLLKPNDIRMPTPAEVQGNWSWIARKDVTTWNEEVPIEDYTPLATLPKDPLRLKEGWLNLSDLTNDFVKTTK